MFITQTLRVTINAMLRTWQEFREFVHYNPVCVIYAMLYFLVPHPHPTSPFYSLLACSPSKVRNLSGSVEFDKSKGTIMASLSWIGPERPCGKVHSYKIVLSSPKTIQNKINEITLDVKVWDTAQYVSLLYYIWICLNEKRTCFYTLTEQCFC